MNISSFYLFIASENFQQSGQKEKQNKANRLTAFAEFEKIKSPDVGAVRLNFIWMMQRNVSSFRSGFSNRTWKEENSREGSSRYVVPLATGQ